MKVILTRSKPLSEQISTFLSSICHATVGGFWQNTKGHSESRHNSVGQENILLKKAQNIKERGRKEQLSKA